MNVCACICKNALGCAWLYGGAHACMLGVHVPACMCVRASVNMSVHVLGCMCMRACAFVSVLVCVCMIRVGLFFCAKKCDLEISTFFAHFSYIVQLHIFLHIFKEQKMCDRIFAHF